MAMFCDAITDGAVAGGLPREQAEAMTSQALASTAALLAADGGEKRPSEVRENVGANPGITIGGPLKLEEDGVRDSISEAVRDAIVQTKKMRRNQQPSHEYLGKASSWGPVISDTTVSIK
ncbi:hypothetical protein SLS64_003924 [Diaporthe eres]